MSEYLDEQEQLARLKSWWDQNGISIVVAVVIALAGLVGWSWYGDQSDTQRQAQTGLLQHYSEAEGEQRLQLAEQIKEEFSNSAVHAFVLFDQAKTAVEEGDFNTARTHLGEVVANSADALIVDLARIRLAKVLRQLDLTEDALSTLAAVKNEGYRALTLETQGDIHAANGDFEKAHLAYQGAVDSLIEGDNRPVLEMKLENAKPFDGQYVEMTDQLTEALKAAAAGPSANSGSQEQSQEQSPEQSQEQSPEQSPEPTP